VLLVLVLVLGLGLILGECVSINLGRSDGSRDPGRSRRSAARTVNGGGGGVWWWTDLAGRVAWAGEFDSWVVPLCPLHARVDTDFLGG